MSIEVSSLGNGLRIATRYMPHATTVSVGIWVNAGARDEYDNEQGIAHMLEHMAFKGTQKRDAQTIATEVENVGGYMNAHTSREETAYYLRLLPEHVELGVDILADILTQSTLPETEIERERGVIIQEIGQSLDTPDDLVFDLFARACFEGHTLARPILGTVDSVSGFSQQDLRGFLDRHYGSGQMLVVAAGAITHDALRVLIEDRLDHIGNAHSAERSAAQWQGGRQIVQRQLEQSHVVFGLSANVTSMKDRFALMGLSTLYGGGMSSRLFQQVREKRGLCYSIFSFAALNSDGGSFAVYAGTSAEQVDEMLEVSATELRAIAEKAGVDEVSRAKAQLRANLLMSRESVSSCGDALARQIMLFGKPQPDEELLAAISDIDCVSISLMAEQLIASGPPAIAVVGPQSDIMSNVELGARLVA
jgi:predicted Zn-dependent peptidase